MIPRFSQNHQRLEVGPGQDAEVAHLHTQTRQSQVQDFIDLVKQSKQARLHAAASFGKHCLRATQFQVRINQSQHSFRCVFSVGIHDDDRIAGSGLLDMSQADRNGSLVTQVAPEPHNSDLPHHSERELEFSRVAEFQREIVDQYNIQPCFSITRRNGLIELADQRGGRHPIVTHRHHHHDP